MPVDRVVVGFSETGRDQPARWGHLRACPSQQRDSKSLGNVVEQPVDDHDVLGRETALGLSKTDRTKVFSHQLQP